MSMQQLLSSAKLLVEVVREWRNVVKATEICSQSKYSSREVGSDTDNVLSGILDVEECFQRDVSEDLFSDISLGDDVKFCMVIEE